MKLMQRDKDIIEFIRTVKAVDAESISVIYFNGSLRSCQKRLKNAALTVHLVVRAVCDTLAHLSYAHVVFAYVWYAFVYVRVVKG